MNRVACFIDGFNLFHALKGLKEQHLKWLDLAALMRRQISSQSEMISAVYYFSALADWLPDQRARHKEYIKALEATGVTTILGQFKEKDQWCKFCGARWKGHEEKETDVNIALWMLNEAFADSYDKALLVSRDSDLKPALQMIKARFPQKELVVVAPPCRGHSNDLIGVADSKRKINRDQVKQSLFGANVTCPNTGSVIAVRPDKYDPPSI